MLSTRSTPAVAGKSIWPVIISHILIDQQKSACYSHTAQAPDIILGPVVNISQVDVGRAVVDAPLLLDQYHLHSRLRMQAKEHIHDTVLPHAAAVLLMCSQSP